MADIRESAFKAGEEIIALAREVAERLKGRPLNALGYKDVADIRAIQGEFRKLSSKDCGIIDGALIFEALRGNLTTVTGEKDIGDRVVYVLLGENRRTLLFWLKELEEATGVELPTFNRDAVGNLFPLFVQKIEEVEKNLREWTNVAKVLGLRQKVRKMKEACDGLEAWLQGQGPRMQRRSRDERRRPEMTHTAPAKGRMEEVEAPVNQPVAETEANSASSLVVEISKLDAQAAGLHEEAANLRSSGKLTEARAKTREAEGIEDKILELQGELKKAEAVESKPRATLETQLADAKERKDQAKKAKNLQGMKTADAEIKEIEAKLVNLAVSEPQKPDPKVALEERLADAGRRMDEEWANEDPNTDTLEAIEAEINGIEAEIAALTGPTPQVTPVPAPKQAQAPASPAVSTESRVMTKHGSNGHAVSSPVPVAVAIPGAQTPKSEPSREAIVARLLEIKEKRPNPEKQIATNYLNDLRAGKTPHEKILDVMRRILSRQYDGNKGPKDPKWAF